MTKRDKTYQYQGHAIHYSVIGKGEPVILVHGGMHADPWGGFEKVLARKFRVFLPHLPGFGASDAVSGKVHSIPLFADVLTSFMRHKRLTRAPVIGFSIGAATALKAFSDARFGGVLILVGMPLGIANRKMKYASMIPLWLRRVFGSTEWGRQTILMPVMRDLVGHLDKKNDVVLQRDLATTDTRALVDLDMYEDIEKPLRGYMAKLGNKTYVVYGSEDKIGRKARFPQREVIVIPGAGHNVFSSQPNLTFGVITDILTESLH